MGIRDPHPPMLSGARSSFTGGHGLEFLSAALCGHLWHPGAAMWSEVTPHSLRSCVETIAKHKLNFLPPGLEKPCRNTVINDVSNAVRTAGFSKEAAASSGWD